MGGVAAAFLILAAFCGVIVFLPPEALIAAPLHDGVDVLLGRASFMLPLALALASGVWPREPQGPPMRP